MVISLSNVSTIALVPGWKVGYLVSENDEFCDYRILPVIAIAEVPGGLEPVVMAPNGKLARASEIGETVFSVGPDESAEKVAQAHAAARGRTVQSLRAAA